MRIDPIVPFDKQWQQNANEDLFSSLIKVAILELEQENIDVLLKKIEDGQFELSSAELDALSNQSTPMVYQLIDRELTRFQRKRFIRHTLPKAGQIAAGILLVLFISATTTLATVRSIRVRVLDFLIRIETEYTNLSLVENEKEAIEMPNEWTGRYYPRYIPDGFVFSSFYKGVVSIELIYLNSNGKVLEFSENGFGVDSNIDTENATIEHAMIRGWQVLLSEKNGVSNAAWHDNEFYYLLRFDGATEEVRKIIKSMLIVG